MSNSIGGVLQLIATPNEFKTIKSYVYDLKSYNSNMDNCTIARLGDIWWIDTLSIELHNIPHIETLDFIIGINTIFKIDFNLLIAISKTSIKDGVMYINILPNILFDNKTSVGDISLFEGIPLVSLQYNAVLLKIITKNHKNVNFSILHKYIFYDVNPRNQIVETDHSYKIKQYANITSNIITETNISVDDNKIRYSLYRALYCITGAFIFSKNELEYLRLVLNEHNIYEYTKEMLNNYGLAIKIGNNKNYNYDNNIKIFNKGLCSVLPNEILNYIDNMIDDNVKNPKYLYWIPLTKNKHYNEPFDNEGCIGLGRVDSMYFETLKKNETEIIIQGLNILQIMSGIGGVKYSY